MSWGAGLRFAIGTLSVFPVRVERIDRKVAGRAMLLAPAVGLALATVCALPLLLPLSPLLGSALALGLLALLTRGLHLDGLADLADGLGSGRPAPQALEIMKKSDIGPFGVITLLFALLVQVSALADTALTGTAPAALVAACVTGRLTLAWACRAGVPSARPGGLGDMVSGTVRRSPALAATLLVLLGVALLTFVPGSRQVGVLVYPAAALAGLGVAALLLRHAVRRLGGITGDVLGALVETATATALVVCALLG